jgi:cobalt-zinc-cadmium efflux system protein
MCVHAHDHTHPHAIHNSGKKLHGVFALGTMLNLVFVGVEVFFGLHANSLALLADAAHNFGDVLSLLVAWLGYQLAFSKPTKKMNFGWGRVSLYATIFNGLSLAISSLWIIYEAIQRFQNPVLPQNIIVAIVATVGIFVNFITAILLMRGRGDLNIRAAMQHMFADAALSAAVVASALLMMWTGYIWFDPVVSIIISTLILISAGPLLSKATNLALGAVPNHIDYDSVMNQVQKTKNVVKVKALYIWAISTTETALITHVEIHDSVDTKSVREEIEKTLQQNYHIQHITIQIV